MRRYRTTLFLLTVIAPLLHGCDAKSNPAETVRQKCEKLQKLADAERDLDEGSHQLARESMEDLCQRAIFECTNEPRGPGCRGSLERLSMVP